MALPVSTLVSISTSIAAGGVPATSVAGFPPKGRQSLAALRRSIHEEFFI